jgi:hypothetical protein
MGEVSGQDRAVVRLPPRRFSFVGRTVDLGEIAARLGRYAVVTLTGVGGIGKTALAVEAAWTEVSAGRAELACFVDLVPCRTDEQVVAALVEGVGIRGAWATALPCWRPAGSTPSSPSSLTRGTSPGFPRARWQEPFTVSGSQPR